MPPIASIGVRDWRMRLPFRWRLRIKIEFWRQPREEDLPTIEDLQKIFRGIDDWYDRSKEQSS